VIARMREETSPASQTGSSLEGARMGASVGCVSEDFPDFFMPRSETRMRRPGGRMVAPVRARTGARRVRMEGAPCAPGDL